MENSNDFTSDEQPAGANGDYSEFFESGQKSEQSNGDGAASAGAAETTGKTESSDQASKENASSSEQQDDPESAIKLGHPAARNITDPEQTRKIFIGGLSLNVTDEMLQEYFSKWGEVVDCIVMKDNMTRRSRGFGFITYSRAESVDTAMQSRPHVIDGKEVDTKRAVPREMSNKAESQVSVTKLYVSGIGEELTSDDLREFFKQHGAVTDVEIPLDKTTGKARGFAFVTFDDYDPVDKLIILRQFTIKGRRVEVKKALSKGEMQRASQVERDRVDRAERFRGGGFGPRGGGFDSYRGGGNRRYGGGGGGGQDWGQGGWGGGYGGPSYGYGQGGYGQGYGNQNWGSYGGWNQSSGQGWTGYGHQGGGYQSR